jgi:predicted Zn finger-like uncharacterized protein
MSLATTCTNCSTCFRVVQDQLRVSEGWVRCGHCQQVFNALESLFDLDAPHQPVALPPAAPGPGRGVWQTEATARWMRQRSSGHDAPAEREEPLSDDVLAALQAEAAPVLPAVEEAPEDAPDDEDDTFPAPVDLADETAAAPAPEALPLPRETSAEAALAVEREGPPAASLPPEPVEPSPLDDGIGETAFAPFPVTDERREPVFEATHHEPHGFGEDGAPDAVPATLDLEAEAERESERHDLAAQAEAPREAHADAGPTSAAMLLSEPAEPPGDLTETRAEADPEEILPPPETRDEPAVVEAPLESSVPEPSSEPTLPSFLAAAAQRDRWERPAARWAFGALAGLLGLVLVGQVAWHWRERLAMAWPVTQGPLASLCAAAGCELGAPREINAVVVDNTALARPPGSSGYRLTVQLHNRATHPVATPSVDLVLTDAQGAVVARRVLSPADFDYREPALAAQAELQWTAEFTLAEGTLVGYTVAAFYP